MKVTGEMGRRRETIEGKMKVTAERDRKRKTG